MSRMTRKRERHVADKKRQRKHWADRLRPKIRAKHAQSMA